MHGYFIIDSMRSRVVIKVSHPNLDCSNSLFNNEPQLELLLDLLESHVCVLLHFVVSQ